MTAGDVDDVVARAEHALADVGRDPRAALAEADAVVTAIPRPRAPEQVRAVVTAHRAAGLALRELSELEMAEARMRRGVRVADRNDLPALGAEARMSLAYVVMERGRLRQALSLTTRALQTASGPTAYRLMVIRAMTLQRTGRGDEALADYAVALPATRRARDTVWESRLLNNRAILLAIRGQTKHAVHDFERAREIYLVEGLTTDAAAVLYNLGYLYGMAGDIPRALEHLDAAASESGDLDRPEYWAGRAEILTRAGLSAEATADASRAVALLAERGWRAMEAQAWVGLAAAQLAARDPDPAAAATAAGRARRLLQGQGRPEWTAFANYVGLLSSLRSNPRVPIDRVERVAEQLRSAGLEQYANDLRLEAALQVLERSPGAALRLLSPVADGNGGAGLWERRSAAAVTRSLGAMLMGDATQAGRLLKRAWEIADDAQSLLGSTDLRAGSAERSRRLVDVGVGQSLARGRADATFDWVERGRCVVLRHPPARPAADPAVADALTRWRWASATALSGLLEGAASRHDAQVAVAAERQVTRLARHQRAALGESRPASARQVRVEIGSGVFIQYFPWKGDLWATVLSRRSIASVRLCPAEEAMQLLTATAFTWRRVLGTAHGAPGLTHDLGRLLDSLDRCLVTPLGQLPAGQTVIVCPTSGLMGLPWPLLPSLADAVVSVAPSATTWLRAKSRPLPAALRLVAASGPGLPGAVAECETAGRLYPSSQVLTGLDVTAGAVTSASRDADVLHVAAHGQLRRDNPLFSALALADGPLCGYDIASWPSAPSTVILSACNAGATAAVAGDEVLGLASIVLGAGARTVIAAAVPVPDGVTAYVMGRLHERLAAGLPAAQALHDCQRSFDDDVVTQVVARSFVAVGA